jgi:hypothetical protein
MPAVQDFAWMRVKCDEYAPAIDFPGFIYQRFYERTMTQMDAVESTDRYGRILIPGNFIKIGQCGFQH